MLSSQRCRQARLARDRRFDGRFFVAVKTTGIFCRPICPAPHPKEANVEYFALAELAMRAGYRPCLRCRPDSAPESPAWKGSATTLERGLKLIREYPQLPITALAAKLGIGERYFRLLFQQHLGVSPKQFQLFQRLLFAKQLLQQSALTVEQVAQASGFASSRSLQQQMRVHLRLSPSRLRNGGARAQPLALQLAFRPPYNWVQVRDFLRVRAVPGMEWVTADSYARTFTLGAARGWFQARFQEDSFAVTIELDDMTWLKSVITQIRRLLDLDADSHLITRKINAAGLKQRDIVPGLRLPGVFSPFEAGCRAILGQQIAVGAAIKLLTSLVQRLGEPCGRGWYFPLPAKVAASDLAFLGTPETRRRSLRALAEFVDTRPDACVDDWLRIRGIGPWTVNYVKMRGLSEPDVWLAGDLVIKKQLQKYPVDAERVSPWRSYLTFQLWSMA